MSETTRLDGRIAVVTGSSSGIGHAIAQRLAAEGACVVVNARTQARAEAAAADIVDRGGKSTAIAADVSTAAGVAALFERTLEKYETIDILVNNAGAPSIRAAEELSLEDWQRTLDLNLTGPFLCAQAAGRVMLAKGSGVIINVSSMLAHISLPGRLAYSVTKRGLDGLTSTLGVEWARRGVRVVSVNPAYVATPLVEGAMKTGRFSMKDVERRTPMGRIATSEEVANVVAFLASGAASYVTATTLLIDGGWTQYGGWE
jgi:3-oxoacyl-[acyl-carrier protein] reductase